MSGFVIDPEKLYALPFMHQTQCPFNAMAMVDGQVQINAACKMCRICVCELSKSGDRSNSRRTRPPPPIDKAAVAGGGGLRRTHVDGRVHPVTLELIGKARELAAEVIGPAGQLPSSSAITVDQVPRGMPCSTTASTGVVSSTTPPALAALPCRSPTPNVFEDCVQGAVMPAVVLVGATRQAARSLAPRRRGPLPHRPNGRLHGAGNARKYRSGADPPCFRRQHHGSDSSTPIIVRSWRRCATR